MRLRGTIEKVDGNTLTLKTSDGEAKLSLTGDARVVAVVKATMAEVKEGTFLGSAAMPQPDGSQKALEVHIFPEQMRGTGEGHRPYAPVREQHHDQRHRGGRDGGRRRRLDHPPQVQGRREEDRRAAGRADHPLRDRQRGRSQARRGVHGAGRDQEADGTYEAARINVGRDGAQPN